MYVPSLSHRNDALQKRIWIGCGNESKSVEFISHNKEQGLGASPTFLEIRLWGMNLH
jgi:hypothetical protein